MKTRETAEDTNGNIIYKARTDRSSALLANEFEQKQLQRSLQLFDQAIAANDVSQTAAHVHAKTGRTYGRTIPNRPAGSGILKGMGMIETGRE